MKKDMQMLAEARRHGLLIALLVTLPFVVALPAASVPAGVLGTFVLAAHLAQCVRARHFSLQDVAVFALAALALFSIWITPQFDVTLLQTSRLLYGLALFVCIARSAMAPRAARAWLAGLSGALLALCVVAPFVIAWMNDKFFLPASLYAAMPRLALSDTANPNVFAGAIALLAPFALSLLLHSIHALRRQPKSLHYWFACVLGSVSFVAACVIALLTQSRAGLAALLIGVLVTITVVKPRITLVLAAIGIVAVGVAVVVAGGEQRGQWVQLLVASPNSPQSAPAATAIDKRLELWGRALDLIAAHPIAGAGLGNFQVLAAQTPYIYNLPNIPHAHNLLLQIAVDLGIAGLSAWLILICVGMRTAFLNLRAACMAQHMLAAAIIGALVAVLVHGMVDAVLWGMTRPSVLLWVVMGLACAQTATRFPASDMRH